MSVLHGDWLYFWIAAIKGAHVCVFKLPTFKDKLFEIYYTSDTNIRVSSTHQKTERSSNEVGSLRPTFQVTDLPFLSAVPSMAS